MPPRTDPFDLSDKKILDPEPDHVRVERKGPRTEHESAVYEKTFKQGYEYWNERELAFFAKFIYRGTPRVVVFQDLSKGNFKTSAGRAVRKIVTFDGGLTVSQWLTLAVTCPDGTVLAHPFQHVESFLKLTRACVEALESIHNSNVIHCDIKCDNICVPYSPYPFDPRSGAAVTPDLEGLRLIDFAFSIDRDKALLEPLPIAATEDYQAPAFKAALETSRATGNPASLQSLHSSIDRYSLAVMLADIFNEGLKYPNPPFSSDFAARVASMIDTISDFGSESVEDTPRHIAAVYRVLFDQLDSLVNELSAHRAPTSFRVIAAPAASASAARPTPITPLVQPAAVGGRASPPGAARPTPIVPNSNSPANASPNQYTDQKTGMSTAKAWLLGVVLLATGLGGAWIGKEYLSKKAVELPASGDGATTSKILAKLGPISSAMRSELASLLTKAAAGNDEVTLAAARQVFRSLDLSGFRTLDRKRARELNGLALTQRSAGNVKEAYKTQLQSFELDPLTPEFASNLSHYALLVGEDALAERIGIHSIALPREINSWGSAFYWDNLAVALAKRGDAAGAASVWWVTLAGTADLQKRCNSVLHTEKQYPGIMRQPATAFFDRINSRAKAKGEEPTGACTWPPAWR